MDGPSGPEAIMVICPEHAKIIAGDGFSKKDVQKFIWERAAYRMKDLPDETFEQRVKRRSDLKLTRDSVIPVTDRPEDILVIVAGGDGSQSQYIHVWGRARPRAGRRGVSRKSFGIKSSKRSSRFAEKIRSRLIRFKLTIKLCHPEA